MRAVCYYILGGFCIYTSQQLRNKDKFPTEFTSDLLSLFCATSTATPTSTSTSTTTSTTTSTSTSTVQQPSLTTLRTPLHIFRPAPRSSTTATHSYIDYGAAYIELLASIDPLHNLFRSLGVAATDLYEPLHNPNRAVAGHFSVRAAHVHVLPHCAQCTTYRRKRSAALPTLARLRRKAACARKPYLLIAHRSLRPRTYQPLQSRLSQPKSLSYLAQEFGLRT